MNPLKLILGTVVLLIVALMGIVLSVLVFFLYLVLFGVFAAARAVRGNSRPLLGLHSS
jgi:uncharacterized membrane protein